MERNKITEKIKRLPEKPGVYMMLSSDGSILYIGKAKNLRNRVSSYFQKSSYHNEKISLMVSKIADVDIIITDSETEALILESNLIKKHKPPFNIELKENDRYPYIKITNEKFPRILKTRLRSEDSAVYFGPYPSSRAITRTIKTITDLFPIRRCNRKITGKDKPCLNYYLGKCKSPCSGKIGEDEYRLLVEQVVLFLKGEKTSLVKKIKKEIEIASESLNFEYAIELRERLKAIETIFEEQKITTPENTDTDYIGLVEDEQRIGITILTRRRDKIIGKFDFDFDASIDKLDVLEQFLDLYYSQSPDIPGIIVVPLLPDNIGPLINFLESRGKKNVIIRLPANATEKKLINMATKNANYRLKEKSFEYSPEKSLEELKVSLNLPAIPGVIEGFDVATILGNLSTASMVRFVNGIPDKKGYRRYKIRYTGGQNDIEMIKEAVARRYQRLLNEGKKLPDLVLIDGGAAHVAGAAEIMDKLGVGEIPIVGLAKRFEHVYVRGSNNPVILPKTGGGLKLLMAVRDEAHRFANSYHFKLREKEKLTSAFEKIHGIGKQRASKILSNLENLPFPITVEHLKRLDGIGDRYAENVYRVLLEFYS